MARSIVQWVAAAVRDIERVDEFFSARNERAAIELNAAVNAAVESLARLPRRGRAVRELRALGIHADYREIIVSRHRLVYRIEGRRLFIVAFFDSRRDAETFLQSRLTGSD